jgi:hypothetical protein
MRVSAVENHLLKKQEETLTKITSLRKDADILKTKRTQLSSDWISQQEKTEGEKVAKEVADLSFSKGLEVSVTSEWDRSEEKENKPLLVKIHIGESKMDRYSSSNRIHVKTVKINQTQKHISEIRGFNTQIENLESDIATEARRLEKIGGLLANMDREERRAKALLVQSKLSTMEGGEEMVAALIGGMPEV